MSRLLVITRNELAVGFQLAGVTAYGVETIEAAQELINHWLEVGESGLVAIDDGILTLIEPGVLERLEKSLSLLFIAIPGRKPLDAQISGRNRITAMIRQIVGFHITFREEVHTETIT